MDDATKAMVDDPTRAIKRVRGQKDPAERLIALAALLDKVLPALATDIRRDLQATITELHEMGIPYAALGRRIGLSRGWTVRLANGEFGGRKGGDSSDEG